MQKSQDAYLVVYSDTMIEQGKLSTLKIIKRSTFGLYLGDESGEEVLLPNKYCTDEMKPGGQVEVFIYRDSEGRKVATTLSPKIALNEFALLKVNQASAVGAFMDWGLEKDLMVPFREQKQNLEAGRWYIVYMDLDQKTDRLYASNRIERFLQNDSISVKEGDEVNLLVWQKTDLGYNVIINHIHKGLIFDNEIFTSLRIGEQLPGYIKKIREDGKIDVAIQAAGYTKTNDTNSEVILKKLNERGGFLSVTDKSSPEDIYSHFGISKKAFKKSIGSLYKQKVITLESDGIKLMADPPAE
ncbi:MAG: S1-like domain-containing RNA-binding protein [Bacteroides sp.]|nr:S1-like domain-containing RNA-binding protein [Bacteroides sp.]